MAIQFNEVEFENKLNLISTNILLQHTGHHKSKCNINGEKVQFAEFGLFDNILCAPTTLQLRQVWVHKNDPICSRYDRTFKFSKFKFLKASC